MYVTEIDALIITSMTHWDSFEEYPEDTDIHSVHAFVSCPQLFKGDDSLEFMVVAQAEISEVC